MVSWNEAEVVLQPAERGRWVATIPSEDAPLMATGFSRADAKRRLKALAAGAGASRERPYLELCTPCNRRAAEAGSRAYDEGVEVCNECAAAIDGWRKDYRRWVSRTKRNKRKSKHRETQSRKRKR